MWPKPKPKVITNALIGESHFAVFLLPDRLCISDILFFKLFFFLSDFLLYHLLLTVKSLYWHIFIHLYHLSFTYVTIVDIYLSREHS